VGLELYIDFKLAENHTPHPYRSIKVSYIQSLTTKRLNAPKYDPPLSDMPPYEMFLMSLAIPSFQYIQIPRVLNFSTKIPTKTSNNVVLEGF
jgi:hypothetical protein